MILQDRSHVSVSGKLTKDGSDAQFKQIILRLSNGEIQFTAAEDLHRDILSALGA